MERPAPADSLPPVSSLELPTLGLAVFCYTGWLLLTLQYGHWPLWILAPAMVLLLTLHSSLQHEVLHGHPTRSVRLNRLLGLPPLSLWIPYERFRTTHLVHHVNARLTDPFDDPESNYWTPESLATMPAAWRLLVRVDATLAGRVLIGPWWRIARFLVGESRAFARNDPGVRAAWIEHLVLCVPVVWWLSVVCGMPLWVYMVTMAVPGNGILLIRSYAEHRALADVSLRTAIVENSWFLGPLFLFNNLHALHHEEPGLPWYRYHQRYRHARSRLLQANGGLVYSGYGDVARRFLFSAHDVLAHPLGRAPGALQTGKVGSEALPVQPPATARA